MLNYLFIPDFSYIMGTLCTSIGGSACCLYSVLLGFCLDRGVCCCWAFGCLWSVSFSFFLLVYVVELFLVFFMFTSSGEGGRDAVAFRFCCW